MFVSNAPVSFCYCALVTGKGRHLLLSSTRTSFCTSVQGAQYAELNQFQVHLLRRQTGAYCIRAGLHGHYSCSDITAHFSAPDSCSIRPCQIILLIYNLIKKHSSSKETLNLSLTRSLQRTLNNNTCSHQVTKSSSSCKSYESCQSVWRDECCGFVKAVQSLLREADIFHRQSMPGRKSDVWRWREASVQFLGFHSSTPISSFPRLVFSQLIPAHLCFPASLLPHLIPSLV